MLMGLDQRLLATFTIAVLLLSFVYVLGSDQSQQTAVELIGFNQTGASCAGPDSGGVSFDVEQADGEERRITVTGAVSTSNPCYVVKANIENPKSDAPALKVKSESEGGMCVQCVGRVSYEAQMEASGADILTVYHDGQQVKQFSLANSS